MDTETHTEFEVYRNTHNHLQIRCGGHLRHGGHLEKITKNLKITNYKDLPHQLFQKVRTSNMLFILLGLTVSNFSSVAIKSHSILDNYVIHYIIFYESLLSSLIIISLTNPIIKSSLKVFEDYELRF